MHFVAFVQVFVAYGLHAIRAVQSDSGIVISMRKLVLPILTTLALLGGATAASAKWQMACDKRACELTQTLSNDAGKRVATVVLPKLFQDKAPRQLGFVLLPLGIHIPSSVQIRVDSSKKLIPATLLDCNANTGCRAVFDVTPQILNSFKAGRKVTFTVVDGFKQRAVTFTFTLNGFTKAHRKFGKTLVAGRKAK